MRKDLRLRKTNQGNSKNNIQTWNPRVKLVKVEDPFEEIEALFVILEEICNIKEFQIPLYHSIWH